MGCDAVDLPIDNSVSLPAEIAWLVIIGAVIVFEVWALITHHNTLSQYIQHKGRWFRWLVEVLVGILGLHLFGVI